MNFEKAQDKLKGPIVPASSDAMIYEIRGGEVWVLTGIRGNDPWKGYLSLAMGGYMDPEDVNPLATAKRETREETGAVRQEIYGLSVEIEFLVGIYGPHRWHYKLALHTADDHELIRTEEQAHILPVLALVFGARVTGGAIRDTDEQKGVRFMPLSAIVEEYGNRIVFDHALALHHLVGILREKDAMESARAALKLFY
ncbi:MAG: NUDIX domain-containing protein [Patescibacteria group bacterium]